MISNEVYDHVEPSTRAGPFEKEPLLVDGAPAHPAARCLNGAQDPVEVWLEFRMAVQDVRPRGRCQYNRAPLRVDHLLRRAIVPALPVRDNCSFPS